ncbi:hypothetical protein BABINDRAFT_162821 [Babjeviella inositovora NRRL Y-12698]|uniref:Ribosomal RNA-processing protein 7 C-terminal domain-containing protein n=1 Tax=Babjeviella inositovora NRRL Y-12698 TaxID=984486 RepID=A0A1E3QKK4_9ASCO|nr:uncharacterized protein BABINDRAFT_162821 [Babjeviella inositovora NRRL Y-12698]ODQ78148.1 hypothetical protein BABINDRAFT_162821 [Babjeviella inositovora NRRL Y-12698]
MSDIKGFTTLPIILPPSNSTSVKASPVVHYAFFKKHSVPNSNDADLADRAARSLFFVNLPSDAGFNNTKKFFTTLVPGTIISSVLKKKLGVQEDFINFTKLTSEIASGEAESGKNLEDNLPNGTALVEFVDKKNMNNFVAQLKAIIPAHDAAKGENQLFCWPVDDVVGTKRYQQRLHQAYITETDKLQQYISQSLVNFTRKETAAQEALQAPVNLVDEDGFTLVVSSHRKTKQGILNAVNAAQSSKVQEEVKNKLKKKEKEDFYRYQIREKKKREMQDLLDKFKSDQARVEDMKSRKRFRPY